SDFGPRPPRCGGTTGPELWTHWAPPPPPPGHGSAQPRRGARAAAARGLPRGDVGAAAVPRQNVRRPEPPADRLRRRELRLPGAPLLERPGQSTQLLRREPATPALSLQGGRHPGLQLPGLAEFRLRLHRAGCLPRRGVPRQGDAPARLQRGRGA
ncbi:unnamed protein product, partial [Prorocentrum cordatum]